MSKKPAMELVQQAQDIVPTAKPVKETPVISAGCIEYADMGTHDAQQAINGMNSVMERFTEVAQTATSEEIESYRKAYVSVCKAAGTGSSAARASECNRVFHNVLNNRAFTLDLMLSGRGYHAVIRDLPTVKKSGAPKTENTESSLSKGTSKAKSADTALAEVFTDLTLIKVDNGTCKALLNAVLGLMETSSNEYLVGLANTLSDEWAVYEEAHEELTPLLAQAS